MYGLMDGVWISASVAGGWWVARRRLPDPGLALLLLGSLALTCVGAALIAAVPAVAWLAPVSVLGGLGNGGVNIAAGVLLGRRAPAAVRGRAFAVFGAVANGATVAGFVLGGVLLTVVPVRAAIAAAGLGGLAVTAAFARSVLRARALEPTRGEAGPGRPGPGGPDRGKTGRGETGPGRPDRGEPGRGEPGRHGRTGRVSAGRRAGAAEPGRPLR